MPPLVHEGLRSRGVLTHMHQAKRHKSLKFRVI